MSIVRKSAVVFVHFLKSSGMRCQAKVVEFSEALTIFNRVSQSTCAAGHLRQRVSVRHTHTHTHTETHTELGSLSDRTATIDIYNTNSVYTSIIVLIFNVSFADGDSGTSIGLELVQHNPHNNG